MLKCKRACLVSPLASQGVNCIGIGLCGKKKRCNVVQNDQYFSDAELKFASWQYLYYRDWNRAGMGKLKKQPLPFLEKQSLAGLSPRFCLPNPELSLGSLSPPAWPRVTFPEFLMVPHSWFFFSIFFGLQYWLEVAVHFIVFKFWVGGNTMKNVVQKGAFLTELVFSCLPQMLVVSWFAFEFWSRLQGIAVNEDWEWTGSLPAGQGAVWWKWEIWIITPFIRTLYLDQKNNIMEYGKPCFRRSSTHSLTTYKASSRKQEQVIICIIHILPSHELCYCFSKQKVQISTKCGKV